MKKLFLQTLFLFIVSYIVAFFVVYGIVIIINDQMSGIFRFIIIISAALISTNYFCKHLSHFLDFSLKAWLFACFVSIAIVVDISAYIFFGIPRPPVLFWIFHFVILMLFLYPKVKITFRKS